MPGFVRADALGQRFERRSRRTLGGVEIRQLRSMLNLTHELFQLHGVVLHEHGCR
jgi:hypothetical protein